MALFLMCRDARFCVSTKATMTDKFKDKYRPETARLKGWNYASTGYYFVTICEKNRSCVFGDVFDGTITLMPLGQAVMGCWLEIPEHFPFVDLDSFCIMPNHIHGIIIINSGDVVETQNLASLQGNEPGNKFGPQSKNLASIVRGFKIGVTKYAHANDIDFAWQPRYHDRIIRDEQELFAVRTYIRNNPLEWVSDEYSDGRDVAGCRDAKSCVSTEGGCK
jgi:putative transposase